MVAAIDDSAKQESTATVEAGDSKTAISNQVRSSLVSGKPPGAESQVRALGEAIQSSNALPAQASATSSRTIVISRQEAGHVAEEVSTYGAASTATQIRRAKPGAADQPASLKLAPPKSDSQSVSDSALAIAASILAPLQPAQTVTAPVHTAVQSVQTHTSFSSFTDAGAHQGIGSQNQIQHGTVSNSSMTAPETEPTGQDSSDRSTELSAAVTHGPSGSLPGILAHSAESEIGRQVIAAGHEPIQSTALQDLPSSTVLADPSTLSAARYGGENSPGSVSEVGAVRSQIAAARAQVAQGNRSGDWTTNPAAVQSVHSEIDASAAGSAVTRDAGRTLYPAPGQEAPAPAASGISTGETFAALDGATSKMQPTWIHAGPHQAEAGFHDPVLGWVSVRAGADAGGISAVVVPGSADATAALGAHMAGLHDYLREQQSPVESLTLARNATSGEGFSEGMHQGQQQSDNNGSADAQASHLVAAVPIPASAAHTMDVTGPEIPTSFPGLAGTFISVMA